MRYHLLALNDIFCKINKNIPNLIFINFQYILLLFKNFQKIIFPTFNLKN